MKKALVAYIPVLHKGYTDLLDSEQPSAVYLLAVEDGQRLPPHLDYIARKDSIRAVPAPRMARVVQGVLDRHIPVHTTTLDDVRTIALLYEVVVMPDEDISRWVAEKYLPGVPVEFRSVFLRWDRDALHKRELAAVLAHATVSYELLDRAFMAKAHNASRKSADWWRQLGGVLVKDGTLLWASCNQHTPYPQLPYVFGDPRSVFKRGVRIECTTAEHAEASLIAEAARQGVSTEGASLYVTTFPCPMCARLVAHSGIKRCYFSTGYAVLDGADVMSQNGVELIYVDDKAPRDP